jgi:hypothetical protein
VNCVCCDGITKRRGFYRNKSFNVQRYECLKCGTSFSDKQPLDNLRVDFKAACQVVNLLCEGIHTVGSKGYDGFALALVIADS